MQKNYGVMLDGGEWFAVWGRGTMTREAAEAEAAQRNNDRWFAIHGNIPSARNADAVIARIKLSRTCRRCHGTEIAGANFTTNPDSGLCDDCCG